MFRISRAVHVIYLLSLYALYIRTIDTLNVGDGEASKDTSVHLTVGVDTHIWGLNFASLRDSSFKRSGLNDKVLLTKLDDSLYWELQVTHSLFVCLLHHLSMGEITHCLLLFSYLSTVWCNFRYHCMCISICNSAVCS